MIPGRFRGEASPGTHLRRVTLVWGLLFLNVLGTPARSPILPMPHKLGQIITQSALPVAFLLALTINRKVFVRPNWFLGLYTVLAAVSVMMSIRLAGIGTTYRGFRLLAFVAVLWLLTPWWRDRSLVLLRSQLLVLWLVLISLVVGFVIAPSKAFSLNYNSSRLSGALWPLPATAVGHYMAELTGLTILLWWCGILRPRSAKVLTALGLTGLIASHTRTAVAGLVAGVLIAGMSLFLSERRVRKSFLIFLVVTITILLPLSPVISSWLVRGQSTTALQSLSGRTSYWGLVLSAPRPETNKIFGSGMTRDSVMNQSPDANGLPIDSSWIATYQNQGIVGCTLEALMFLILLLTALLRPRGPTRALALFLIVYSLISSYTETGLGEASPHLLDLTLAASLLVPRAAKNRYTPPYRRLQPAGRAVTSLVGRPPIPPGPSGPPAPGGSGVLAPALTQHRPVPMASSTALSDLNHGDPRPLTARVRSGALWSGVTTASLRVANFAITAVVAHILAPRSFGIFAIAVTVYSIVVNIGEFGVGSCVVRADLDLDALAPTMVTVATVSTALCAAAMTVFAKPIATALGSQDAAGPIKVLALTVFLIGVFAVPIAQLARDFQQDKLFVANVVGFLPATATLLLLALSGDGAMAFGWSRVVTQIGIGVVALLAVTTIYRPGFNRRALSVLVRFGLPFAIANSINFILLNVDYAFVGHFTGPTALGAYMLAFTVGSAPAGMVGAVVNSVTIPAFSRVKQDAAMLMAATEKSLRIVALGVLPVCALIFILAKPLVVSLYGGQWASSASALSVLSIYAAISLFCVLFSNILTGLGRTTRILLIQLVWLGALVPAMVIGVRHDGIVGAALAHIAVIAPLVLPCYLVTLKRTTGVRLATLGRAILAPLLSSVVAALAAKAVASQFAQPLLQLVTGLATWALVYLVASAPQVLALLDGERIERLREFRAFQVYEGAARILRLPRGEPETA